jgi:hypothetical protein
VARGPGQTHEKFPVVDDGAVTSARERGVGRSGWTMLVTGVSRLGFSGSLPASRPPARSPQLGGPSSAQAGYSSVWSRRRRCDRRRARRRRRDTRRKNTTLGIAVSAERPDSSGIAAARGSHER